MNQTRDQDQCEESDEYPWLGMLQASFMNRPGTVCSYQSKTKEIKRSFERSFDDLILFVT